jgi:hypothetical protein
MYGGVPTVAIPAEAIHQQRPPKRKSESTEETKSSKCQTLRRSLSSTTELKNLLAEALHHQRPPKSDLTEEPFETKQSKRQSLRRSLSSTTELKRSLSKLL